MLRWIAVAASFGALTAPVEACTLLAPSSAAEAARDRQREIDWHAERIAESAVKAEVIFFGKVTAIRPTDMSEKLGGTVRLGWQEVPALRVWASAGETLKGEVPPMFSVYTGKNDDTCGATWSAFAQGDIVLILAERRYSGGHWFGEIVGKADLPDLLPALAKRGLQIPEP